MQSKHTPAWEVRVVLERLDIPGAERHGQKGALSFETTVGVPGDRPRTRSATRTLYLATEGRGVFSRRL
jgi:hypothetical protein